MSTPKDTIYSRPFILLCLSHALFAASFNMMIPELPNYLAGMGGSAYKGWIIALFTLTAGLSRPFSGKLADTVGRLPVMYVGTFACVVCSLAYPQLAFMSGFLALRFMHGFSTGFKPTGTAAYVADIVPDTRRGEAMGMLGIFLNVGASAAPILGSWLVIAYKNYNPMFYVSALLAVLSMLILTSLPETLPKKQAFHPRLLKITKDDIFDPLAMPAAITMIFCYVSYGVILTTVPDLSDHLQVPNRGIFFMLFTLSSISTRMVAARVSDRLGRVPVLKVSAWLIAGAMILFAQARSAEMLYAASILFGLGNGVFSPAINAWTVDLGHAQRKGRALATMYIALEIAIGSGAVLSGWYFADRIEHLPLIFYWAAAMSLFGWVYLWYYEKKRTKV